MAAAEPRSTVENAQMSKVSDGKYKYTNTEFKRVSAKMYDYKCDIKLKIGGQTFRAHKDVLSEASDYFGAMFGHNMREKEQDTIEFHELSPQGFTCMLEYFYHGHVTVDADNIQSVIEASRFFHIEWLIGISCDFLIRQLSLENYDYVLNLADQYMLGDLRKDIFRFMTLNYMTLVEQKAFVMLSEDLFRQILGDDYFIDASEDFIFKSVLKWLDSDPNREGLFVDMLKLVRYPLLDYNTLISIGDDILSKPELRKLVEDAKEFVQAPNRQPLLVSEQTECRGGHDTILMFAAYDDAHLIQYKVPGLEGLFNEEIDTSFLLSVFEFSALVSLGNFIFVVGGYKRTNYCSTEVVYRYNPRNREWGVLKPMQQARVSFTLCAGRRGLYAVGGIDHVVEEGRDVENILDTVEFYDPITGEWRYLPNMPNGAFSMGACVDNTETLFVSGGVSVNPEDDVPVKYFRKLSPGDEMWTQLDDMLTERQGHVMTAFKNKIYSIGGYTTALDSMRFEHCLTLEYFDLEIAQWCLVETILNHGHIHNSLVVLEDKMYLLGGKDQNRMLITFDPEKGEEVKVEYVGELVNRILPARIAFPVDEQHVLVEGEGDKGDIELYEEEAS